MAGNYFDEVNSRVNFPQMEEEILGFWEENKTFEKSLEKTKKGKKFVWYEGPPTANGKPHIGHVITRIFKDVFPRYMTMRGRFVLRKGGWDTHGLPVEVEVEKSLGISTKDEIENIVPGDPYSSIQKFNELCRKSVWKYVDLWEKMVKRVGHWIDLKDAYVTYDNNYIESVWWSLKKLFDGGYLYLGYKVVPYCTRCETPLSSHELAQDYREVEDPSVFPKFRVKGEENVYLVAWTTTPWTLPGNVALAVDEKIDYVRVKDGEDTLILAKEAAKRLGFNIKGVKSVKGKDLVGMGYEPLYAFLARRFPANEKLHSVVSADFVDIEDGTGIVHTAVMYGEEDFELGKKLGLPMHHLVNLHGKFKKDAGKFAGMYVKEADEEIISDLKERDLLWRVGKVTHQYPFCWRCHKPLIYYALESWFIKTTAFKEKLLKNNQEVNWIPKHVRDGRMKNWYETLIDWSLSRNRYWGTPLPIWRCTRCEHMEALDSLDQIKEKAVGNYTWVDFDLHRPWVDEVVIKCEECGGEMKRTPEVIDVWYDSGSMPFAQWHYPAENEKKFAEHFPSDYITEAIDQTRGWFFSLQAISTMLFGKTPYKNVLVFSHALDPEGKKMSKHIGNVLDPWEAFEKHGADATRWFFFSSVSIGTEYRVSVDTIADSLRGFLIPFWNTYNFFVTYANLAEWKPKAEGKNTHKSGHVLDHWILAKLDKLVSIVTDSLDKYDTFTSSRAIEEFVVRDFSQWYIRRSRDRASQEDFLATCYNVLTQVCKLLAPFVPFTAEVIYKNLTKEESVHLADWPTVKGKSKSDTKLINNMELVRQIVEKGHAVRKEKKIPVRQPLQAVKVISPSLKLSDDLLGVIADELNVKEVEWKKGKSLSVGLNTKITKELKEEARARELIRKVQGERKKKGMSLTALVEVSNSWWPEDEKLVEWIKGKTLAKNITKGKFKVEKAN